MNEDDEKLYNWIHYEVKIQIDEFAKTQDTKKLYDYSYLYTSMKLLSERIDALENDIRNLEGTVFASNWKIT